MSSWKRKRMLASKAASMRAAKRTKQSDPTPPGPSGLSDPPPSDLEDPLPGLDDPPVRTYLVIQETVTLRMSGAVVKALKMSQNLMMIKLSRSLMNGW